MIIMVKRAELQLGFADLPAEKARLFHFNIEDGTAHKAGLVVFIDDSRIYVLKADKWPYGKPMSAAELIQYIALFKIKKILRLETSREGISNSGKRF